LYHETLVIFIIFIITAPPIGINIYPNGITVLEGNAFSMYCNATGNPIPQYQWFHDDVMIREGQTYSIAVSDYNAHDGLYTCKAYNSAGYLQKSIDVDVKCKLYNGYVRFLF
jgi:uncharacterized protein YodC (DUF2158 family)